jgi:CcmD family protein
MKNLNSVFAAFLAVWAVFFVYQIAIGRRKARLKDEIDRLKNRLR